MEALWLLFDAQAVALVLATFGLTPSSFWRLMYELLQRLGACMAASASVVYALATYLWPRVIAVATALLEHPWLVPWCNLPSGCFRPLA